jgi:hypothetical protein
METVMYVKKLLLATLFLSVTPRLGAYICGYWRLFKLETNTTVDIICDSHKTSVKHFATEAKFHDILTALNERSENIDLVWEYEQGSGERGHSHSESTEFISSYPMHIMENLKNLNFIAADTCRRSGYAGLFLFTPGRGRQCTNVAGSTFDEPMPFGAERIELMKSRAGTNVFDSYSALYAQTVRDLKRDYFPTYVNRTPVTIADFLYNLAFHAIADLEMLYHTLVSDKQRIIVYCGSVHAARIASFLADNGYILLVSKVPVEFGEETVERDPAELDFLLRGGVEDFLDRLRRPFRIRTESSTAAAAAVAETGEAMSSKSQQK